jgi:glucose/arabinose dehydrogenase
VEAKERLGRIRILAPASGAIAAAPFLDLTGQISTDGERGLLGFAAAPDFATSGVFYVFVTNPLGDIEIRRYRTLAANRDLADPASGDVILSIGHRQFSNHNGGWIGFGPDGFLWIAVGDGGGSGDPNNRAQDLWSLLGKILRIDVRSDAFPGSAAASTAAITGGPTWKAPCPSRAAPAGRRRRLRNMSTAPARSTATR